jgi:hypothetical protein
MTENDINEKKWSKASLKTRTYFREANKVPTENRISLA